MDSEIIPTTPFISSTFLTFTLSDAFLSIAERFMFFTLCGLISVGAPQCGQIDWKELILHCVHFLLAKSTLTLPFLAAVATNLLLPP